MKTKVLTIGFDGLHRSGKGTQIEMLSNYLSVNGIPSLVVRGDGSRAGMNLAPYDFHSIWWQKNLAYFKREPTTIEEKREKADIKYRRLSREARVVRDRVLPNLVEREQKNLGAMLMDRTFVSRFFFCKQVDPEINLDASLRTYEPNGKPVETIIPDSTLILDAPKEVLLSRISREECNPEKYDFKTRIISSNYDLFKETTSELRKKNGVYLIDTVKSPREIHEEILKYCKPLIAQDE